MNDHFDEEESEDTLKDKYLTFHIGNEDYGIEIRHVTEIIGIQEITDVPDTPAYIKGVINLRGKVIPILDVRLRFNMVAKEFDERTCVIVVRVEDVSVGLLVDTVSEVLSIPEVDIEAVSSRKGPERSGFVQAIGKVGNKIQILLDVRKLLFDGQYLVSDEQAGV